MPSNSGIQDLVPVSEIVARPALPPAPSNGKVRPIKRLSIRHRKMIALHLRGLTHREIATELNCHPATVCAVINNPTSQTLLDQAYKHHVKSLRSLVPLSVLAIRDGLVSGDTRVRLQAVDRLHKTLGLYGDEDEEKRTAEDVVREIIRLRNGDSEVTVAREVKK